MKSDTHFGGSVSSSSLDKIHLALGIYKLSSRITLPFSLLGRFEVGLNTLFKPFVFSCKDQTFKLIQFNHQLPSLLDCGSIRNKMILHLTGPQNGANNVHRCKYLPFLFNQLFHVILQLGHFTTKLTALTFLMKHEIF